MKTHYGFSLCAIWIALLPVEGAPLPHSHAVVPAGEVCLALALSLCMLAAVAVLLLNCITCCKHREISFKEFEDNFDDELDFTPPTEDPPSMRPSSEVYTLTVPSVALPGPLHLQPPLITEDPAALQVARHSLSYIQEIGTGWFGKVLLSELSADPVIIRLVVKELKASAGVKEQNDFLQQADPYRVLQHPNVLQCLAQCVEAIPFLLVFEYCELGDLRSYLGQKDHVPMSSDLLQRMACEVAAGVAHLHKSNFLHSDLALRNCFITTDLTVKIGDYGIGPSKYKEDYITTEELTIPLRWMAPELVSELHGAVLTEEQTKPGNVWALGVTLWELLQCAARPYTHLSDREVLIRVIKEQQIKLCKPQLTLPYSDRWYEVLQFCWLPPARRATAEEVHRLLTYLRMQGQRETEEDFEQRWSALKPGSSNRQAATSMVSFPLLKQFADGADEVLTVTETSRGLNFEYVWEAAKHNHYSHSHGGMDTALNYRNMFFPALPYSLPLSSMPVADLRSPGTSPELSDIGGHVDQTSGTKEQLPIDLEKQGEHNLQAHNCGASDTCEISEVVQNKKQHLVLLSSHLGESSIDYDFFGTGIDSKDSNIRENQESSSSDLESPYHANVFRETSSKWSDSTRCNMCSPELPNFNGRTLVSLESADQNTKENFNSSFLGDDQETICIRNMKENSDLIHLTEDTPIDNYLFLHEKCVMKHDQCSSIGYQHLGQDILGAGVCYVSEKISQDTHEVDSDDGIKTAQCPENTLSPKDKILNFNVDLAKSEALLPSSTPATEANFHDQLQLDICSTNDSCIPLHSSESGNGFIFDSDSTSTLPHLVETLEVPECPWSEGQSSVSCQDVTSATVFTAAKNLSLGESVGVCHWDMSSADTKPPVAHNFMSPSQYGEKVLYSRHAANYSASSTIRNTSDSKHNAVSELSNTTDRNMVEPLSRFEKDKLPFDTSSLQISPSHLDQTSCDSLLDNSIPTSLRTFVNSPVTPESLGSLEMHSLLGPAEVLCNTASQKPTKPSYKTADSGYETENVESPEWSSQPTIPVSPAEGSVRGSPGPLLRLQPPPDIAVSVVDSLMTTQQDSGEVICEETRTEAELDLPCSGHQSYRDSAYFSDNDSEPDRINDSTIPLQSSSVGSNFNSSIGHAPFLKGVVEKAEQQFNADVEMESSGAAIISLESNYLLIKSNEPDFVLAKGNWKRESFVCFDDKGDGTEDAHGVTACLYEHTSESEPFKNATSFTLPVRSRSDDDVSQKPTPSFVGDAPRLKEPDVEGRYLGKLGSLSVVSGLEDGMDADGEDENSDDSDDGNVCFYRLSVSSSDSENDAVHRVPVIVTDNSDACSLRSLLKPASVPARRPSHLKSSDSDLRSKAVSFFDDVTVYLFDQDTPTKELGDPSLVAGTVSQFGTVVSPPGYLSRFTSSESSTDEEGGGFEWDDDFAFPEPSIFARPAGDLAALRRTASPPSLYLPPPPPSWTLASSHSRNSLSISSMASFSLTHLTDSDVEQGESSEDGEKD